MICSDVTQVVCYRCGECGQVYVDSGDAVRCCVPWHCKDCGVEVRTYHFRCERCNKARYYREAEKLTEWDGWVFVEGLGHMDGYFRDISELIDYCYDEEIEVPKWAFVCRKTRHELDIDAALEHMTEEAYEYAYDDLRDIDELREFVREWNEKQDVVSYHPDYGRVVELKEAQDDPR